MAGRNQRNEDISDEEMEVDDAEDAGCDSDEEGGLRIDDDIYIPPPPEKLNDITRQTTGRLMITQIVNNNFKSYAGEVVIGPFNKEFSSIIGPNGSGKSNVIDSMLFVFGYRASKIRSKKISVLIHNSHEHPNLRSCTVSVYFQKIIDKEDNNYELVQGSQLIISRTAFKDSSSFYEVNGKKVQFKEIAKILRSEGVDLDHNRFLILQGEVEQISLMKPKAQNEHDSGMLEFLEDIIGTSRYKEPLDKLITKLDEASDELAEKKNRLLIVEKEREDMKEPMTEAVDYLKIENIITKLNYKLCHCKKADCSEQIDIKNNEKIKLDEERVRLKEEMSENAKIKETKNQEMKEKCTKWDAVQKKMDVVTALLDEVRRKDVSLNAELVETNKRRKENMELVKTETSKLDELRRIPDKNTKEIAEFERLIVKQQAAQEKEKNILQDMMANVQGKTEPLIKKRTDLETKLMNHRKEVNEAKARFNLAQSELEIYTTVEATEKGKLTQLQETLQTTAETLRDRKEQLTSFETRIPATDKNIRKLKKDLETLQQREEELRRQYDRLKSDAAEKSAAMSANRSRNQVLNALMEEKRSGRLPGILGRLGDLGAIDAKFDVAMSTACGPLDNVVVDTVDTAQACILFLRTKNIGRATFIPLEKQQRFVGQCNRKISTPENVSRLFDLIKVEDRSVLPAFYYGLHDTLVANDLNQATRIAYGAKRWRVVTLKGELIETSGTMSGGGKTVARGRIGQSVVRAEPSSVDIDKLNANIVKLREDLQTIRNQMPPLEEQINRLTVELKDMTAKRERYKMEFETLKNQAPSLKAQIKIQEKKTADAVSDPGKVKKLTQVVETTRSEFEKVEKNAQSTENEVKKISAEIESISGGKIKEQQKKITTVTKAIEKSKGEICRLQVAIKGSIRNVQKTEEKISQLENDVKKCQEALRQGQQDKGKYEEEAKNLYEKIEKYQRKLADRDEAVASLKEELNEIQKNESKFKAAKIDLDQKILVVNGQLDDFKHKIKDYERRINSLKLNEIPLQALEELTPLTDEEISQLDSRTIAANLAAAKERLPENVPNMQVIKDFIEKDKTYMKRAAVVEEMKNKRDRLRSAYDLVKKRRSGEFHTGFSVITSKLKEMYQMITLGGAAELELVDSMDPFSEGIVFSVRPPKKSWKNISNLSGGEKTLSSLALVFALHHYKPTPLYFMDEIDAALDFKNVSIVGTYIKERTKNAQFIVISLRSEMFELADTLVGIYKTYNATKTATINKKELYKKHPKIQEHDKQRKEKYSSARSGGSQVVLSKACSQALRPKSPAVNLSPAVLTCPAKINRPLSKTPEPQGSLVVAQLHNGAASGETSESDGSMDTTAATTTPERVSRRISLRRSASTSFSDSGTPVRSNSDDGPKPKRKKI